MYVKDLFKPNDIVQPIPVGIPIVLEYSNAGRISKVYMGYEKIYREDISEVVMDIILNNEIVPLSIDIKDITEIPGVLYTDKVVECCGKMPRANQNELLDEFLKKPQSFTFYAGYVQNSSTFFGTPQSTRTWLVAHGFNTLVSVLIPAKIDKQSFAKSVQSSGFGFTYPLIMGYFIFRDGNKFSAYSGLTQITVESVETVMNQYGVIFANLEYGGTSIQIPYSDVVEHNIQSGCTVIFDNDGKIIYTTYLDGMRLSQVVDSLMCDWCHKPFKVNSGTLCRCDDANCLSRRFPQYSHFVSALGFTPLTYELYKENCLNDNIQALADVLDLEPYADERIAITFADFFNAILPTDSGIKANIVHDFVTKCQNKLDRILYYVKNPNKIYEDLDFKDYPHTAFQKWLMNPINNADVLSALVSTHINIWRFEPINTKVLKFEGANIFLTGEFNTTSRKNVEITLNNYGGIISDELDEKVSLVIIGNDERNIDIEAVEMATKLNIPIYRETVFFAHNEDLMDYINATFNNYYEVANWHGEVDS